MKYVLSLILIIGSLFWASFAAQYIYFWGNGCPHCAKVNQYMTDYGVLENTWIDLQKKEVWYDKKNRDEFMAYGQRLWLADDAMWVPFLVVQSGDALSYISWDEPIIKHFQDNYSLQKIERAPDHKTAYIIGWVFIVILIPLMYLLFRPSKK